MFSHFLHDDIIVSMVTNWVWDILGNICGEYYVVQTQPTEEGSGGLSIHRFVLSTTGNWLAISICQVLLGGDSLGVTVHVYFSSTFISDSLMMDNVCFVCLDLDHGTLKVKRRKLC